MKKQGIAETIKTNDEKIEALSNLLNRLVIPQEREKCLQAIIRIQEFQIALIRKAEQDKKERRSQIIAIIAMIIMFVALIIGFTIGADKEAERLKNIREQHMIEQQDLR